MLSSFEDKWSGRHYFIVKWDGSTVVEQEKCTIGVHIIQLVCNFAVLWNETVLYSLVLEQCLCTTFTAL